MGRSIPRKASGTFGALDFFDSLSIATLSPSTRYERGSDVFEQAELDLSCSEQQGIEEYHREGRYE